MPLPFFFSPNMPVAILCIYTAPVLVTVVCQFELKKNATTFRTLEVNPNFQVNTIIDRNFVLSNQCLSRRLTKMTRLSHSDPVKLINLCIQGLCKDEGENAVHL